MERDTPPRVAIAGTGMIGRVHARAAHLAGAALVGVAASTPASSAAAAQELRAGRADSAEALATADDVDVLHVCTPNDSHADLAVLALRHGKHVVLEKPVAATPEGAAAVAEAAAETGGLVAIPFVYRYHPMARQARELVRRGELGDVHLLHGSYLQDWLLDPASTNWRVDPARGGASRAFADIGSHWCDLAAFVSGERFTAVNAVAHTAVAHRNGGDPVATEDTATVLLRTARGVPASVVVSQVAAGRKNRLWLEVDGSRGSAAFDQEEPDKLWLGHERGATIAVRDPDHLHPAAARFAVIPAGHPQGYLDCFDAFVRDAYAGFAAGALPEGTPALEDGLRAAAITDAVLDAAGTGAWTPVADVPSPVSDHSGSLA
jgi:predicted dehydrogenase